MLYQPERRKNGTRRQGVDIAYQVIWNEQKRLFEIQRAGQLTGGTAKNKSSPIGLAIQGAEVDAKDGRTVVVYARRDGRQAVEWSS